MLRNAKVIFCDICEKENVILFENENGEYSTIGNEDFHNIGWTIDSKEFGEGLSDIGPKCSDKILRVVRSIMHENENIENDSEPEEHDE